MACRQLVLAIGCSVFLALPSTNLGQAQERRPEFVFSSASVLRDRPVGIQLRGLMPRQRVTVRAWLKDYSSEMEFIADAAGKVDVSGPQQAARKGEPRVPMAFVWSMRYNPPTKRKDWDSLAPVEVLLVALVDGKEIARGQFTWHYLAANVERFSIKEGKLRGMFFRPKGRGRYPGLMILTGSQGGIADQQAALLAARGYAVLALAYFDYADLPDRLVSIPLEYFEEGLRWLLRQDCVRPGGLAVMGGSRGGELALLLGATFPDVKAVVAIVPSHVVWGAWSRNRRERNSPAWTWKGKAIPSMIEGRVDRAEQRKLLADNPGVDTPLFQLALKDTEAAARATIPVERINGPVLLVSGRADEVWPSAHMAERVVARLRAHKHPYPVRHLSYEDCGHGVYLPFFPTGGDEAGTPAGNAHASYDSWREVVAFLEGQFARKRAGK